MTTKNNSKKLFENYLEAKNESLAQGNKENVFTVDMLICLRTMAEKDVYPEDYSELYVFNEDEHIIWESFLR